MAPPRTPPHLLLAALVRWVHLSSACCFLITAFQMLTRLMNFVPGTFLNDWAKHGAFISSFWEIEGTGVR
jgi:hypothetical protein